MILLLTITAFLLTLAIAFSAVCYSVGDKSILLIFLYLVLVAMAMIGYVYASSNAEYALLIVLSGAIGAVSITIGYGLGENQRGSP